MDTYTILGILILIVTTLFIFTIETIGCDEGFQNITYNDNEYKLMFKEESDKVIAKEILEIINSLQKGNLEYNIQIVNQIVDTYFPNDGVDVSSEIIKFTNRNLRNKLMGINSAIGELNQYARINNLELKNIPIDTNKLEVNPVDILKNKILNANYQNKSQKIQDQKLIKLHRDMKEVTNLLKLLE